MTLPKAARLVMAVLFERDSLFCASSVIVGVIVLPTPLGNFLPSSIFSPSALLFGAQCDHRIDFRCTSSREVTGQQRNDK